MDKTYGHTVALYIGYTFFTFHRVFSFQPLIQTPFANGWQFIHHFDFMLLTLPRFMPLLKDSIYKFQVLFIWFMIVLIICIFFLYRVINTYKFFFWANKYIQVSRELISKFQHLVKEERVYMYNFHVKFNKPEAKTTSHKYYLHFTTGTKNKTIDDGIVPCNSFISATMLISFQNFIYEILVDGFQ